jgi:mRNA-degrading endonuclease toxin of MazEF toxin-antitoxin module
MKGGSVARCEHIRAIDKARLADKIGSISDADMEKIEEGISRILGMNH